MIYTSCFFKYHNNNRVSIARKSPYFFIGLEYPDLFPSSELLKGFKNNNISIFEFRKQYFKQLESLSVHEVANDLENKVLLCWEKRGFCHRHIVSFWFRKNGYECNEI